MKFYSKALFYCFATLIGSKLVFAQIEIPNGSGAPSPSRSQEVRIDRQAEQEFLQAFPIADSCPLRNEAYSKLSGVLELFRDELESRKDKDCSETLRNLAGVERAYSQLLENVRQGGLYRSGSLPTGGLTPPPLDPLGAPPLPTGGLTPTPPPPSKQRMQERYQFTADAINYLNELLKSPCADTVMSNPNGIANLFVQFSSLASAFSGPVGAGIGLASQLALSFQTYFQSADRDEFDRNDARMRADFIDDSCFIWAFKQQWDKLQHLDEKSVVQAQREVAAINCYIEAMLPSSKWNEQSNNLEQLTNNVDAILEKFRQEDRLDEAYREFRGQMGPNGVYSALIQKWIDKLEGDPALSKNNPNLLNRLRVLKKAATLSIDGVTDLDKNFHLDALRYSKIQLLTLERQWIDDNFKQSSDYLDMQQLLIGQYQRLEQKQNMLKETIAYLKPGEGRARFEIPVLFEEMKEKILKDNAPEYLRFVSDRVDENLKNVISRQEAVVQILGPPGFFWGSWNPTNAQLKAEFKKKSHHKSRVCAEIKNAESQRRAMIAGVAAYREYCNAFQGEAASEFTKFNEKCSQLKELQYKIPPPPVLMDECP
ncbi:MAG: hypothetical protein HY390_02990 [Deltaproteobacteria bacterium]|nr:hypothetical protein [Deltaproteobacteria bacterium]